MRNCSWIQYKKLFNQIEYQKYMMQRNKKTACEGPRKKRIQQRILLYLEDPEHAQQNYCQNLEEYLNLNDLDVCFNQLHLHLDKSMLVQVKKNVFLQQGVYILLEGSVTYVWTKNKHDRDRKDHLFSLAKVGAFSNLSVSFNVERQGVLSNGYSLVVNNPFAVLQSELGNINTNQESIFLKIPEKSLQQTNFYRLKSQRLDLFAKIKLPGAKNFSSEPFVSFNSNLHHTFKSKKLYFRNKFLIESLGIVVEGCAQAKSMRGQKKIQFSKYCILLPDLEYEVSSAQIQILEVVKNPTILFNKPVVVQKFIQELNKRASFENQEQKVDLNKYRNKISNSISLGKTKPDKMSNNNPDSKKKKKQFSLFSRECQNYCIVSMELCQENLHRIKKINKQLLKTEKKNKKPHVLFNFSKKQEPGHLPNQNFHQNSICLQKHIESSSCHKDNLMERYSIYAKDMYYEYKKQQKEIRMQNLVCRKATERIL